mmetsp:Transcript_30885/g.82794  ORF Transcript_30885/g.82794 Transcript_30885/m.82794 type:complete len:223 (-) Transcript_30885:1182-1850(-)
MSFTRADGMLAAAAPAWYAGSSAPATMLSSCTSGSAMRSSSDRASANLACTRSSDCDASVRWLSCAASSFRNGSLMVLLTEGVQRASNCARSFRSSASSASRMLTASRCSSRTVVRRFRHSSARCIRPRTPLTACVATILSRSLWGTRGASADAKASSCGVCATSRARACVVWVCTASLTALTRSCRLAAKARAPRWMAADTSVPKGSPPAAAISAAGSGSG